MEYEEPEYESEESEEPEAPPEVPTKTVSRKLLDKASALDKHRRIGGTTPGSEEDVLVVTNALVEEGLLSDPGEGAFDRTVIQALKEFGSLEELADKYGFSIKED